MKIWLLVVAILVLGIVLGIGTAVVHFQSMTWDISSLDSAPVTSGHQSSATLSDAGEPLATVDNAVHDFGVMEASGNGSHEFVITNEGTSPLELTAGGTTCKCTLSEISKEEVPPGQSATVTVAWKGKNNAGEFRHTANIITNDPRNSTIVLTIEGRMTGTFRSSPQELTFSRVTAGDSAVGKVKLFSYVDKTLEISGVKVSDPEHLEVSISPLSAEEIEKEPDAKSGKLLHVAVKSGLPLGRFVETITLNTNLKAIETFEIPVQGTIAGEISIIGPRYESDSNVLYLGVVDPAVGKHGTLLIRVGGVNRKEVKFQLGTVAPDLLETELGQSTESSDGRLILTKLTIRVPKGSRPAVCLGPSRENLGCVTIETTSTASPDLNVYVNFAVGR